MAKHILVSGSPGSGKSIFCAALALTARKRKKKSILIGCDSVIPMLSFFCGDADAVGLGTLCLDEITPQRTAEAVKLLREYPEIGVMGFRLGEICKTITVEQVRQLYDVLHQMVDIVIWDAGSDLKDTFQSVLLPCTDIRVCILTTDPKGLLHFEQNRELLQHFGEQLFLEGLGRPYSAREEMGSRIGGFRGMLPYSREIERCVMEGRIFAIERYCTERYQAAMDFVLEKLERTV